LPKFGFRLCENFAKELSEFQLVCFYCSEILTENNINAPCYINQLDFEMPKNCEIFDIFEYLCSWSFILVQGYTEKVTKFKHRGNDRHYFHKPKKEFLQVKQDVYPKLSDYESAEKLYNHLFSVFSKNYNKFNFFNFDKIIRNWNF